jgi:hypothetical protein
MTVTLDASASIDLAALLGRHAEVMDRATGVIQRALMEPVQADRADARLYPASGDLVLELGGPEQGMRWDVLTMIVGGVTWATAAAGTALLVKSGQRPISAAAVGLSAIRDTANPLPLPAGYGKGQIVLRNPEKLYIIITGGTAAQQYVAACSIEESQEGTRTAVVGT